VPEARRTGSRPGGSDGSPEQAEPAGPRSARPPFRHDPAELAQLAERIAGGSPDAEAELVERFQDRMRKLLTLLLYRRGIPQPDRVAQELTQETLWRAVLRIRQGALVKSASLAAFVHGIAINVANEHAGKERISQRLPLDAVAGSSDPDPGPEFHAIQAESSRWTRRLLSHLRPRDSDILVRFYLQGESKEAICRELELGSGQFDQIKSRALRRARSAVEKSGGGVFRRIFSRL